MESNPQSSHAGHAAALIVGAFLAVTLLGAGCAGKTADTTTTKAPASPSATHGMHMTPTMSPGMGPGMMNEVNITLTDFGIQTPATSFKVGTAYRFVVTNAGAVAHEFMIMPRGDTDHHKMVAEIKADRLPAGATATVDWTPSAPAELEFACHVAGHYEAGMVTNITVAA